MWNVSKQSVFTAGRYIEEQLIQSHLIAYYTKLQSIGTMVVMKLENDAAHTLKEVFDMFAPLEDGFADEVFRVFQNRYPEIQLEITNANETVLGMVQHVKR